VRTIPRSISRAESQGKRLLDRVGVYDEGADHVARRRPRQREHAPLRRDVPDLDPAEFAALRRGFGHEEVAVIVLRCAGGDDVEVVLGQPDDGELGAHRPGLGERIAQGDAPRLGQAVAGEPVEEARRPRPADAVLGEGGGVDQAAGLAHGPRLGLRERPPAPAAEAAGGVVVEALRRVVDRPLPAVHLPELRAARLHTVVAGGGPQGAGGRALLVGVVQDEDVRVGLLVLGRRVVAVHPAAEAPRVERPEVDLGLACGDELGEVVARAAGGGDAEAEPFGEVEVRHAGGGADQRIAVRRVADRAVEVLLQAEFGGGRDAVAHRQVFGLDALEVERQQVGAEGLRHAELGPDRGGRLIGAENPAAALLADIPSGVGVAEHRVLGVGLAPFDQRGVGLGDDVLVLDRDGGEIAADHRGGALGVVAGGCDDHLRDDLERLGADEIAAALRHDAALHDPVPAAALEGVDLGAAHDLDAALAGALGERLGHVGRVDVAVGRVEQRADQIIRAHKRIAFLDLTGLEPFEGHAHAFGGAGVEAVFVHPLARLRHAQVADHRESGVEAGLRLQRLVELHAVVVDVADRVAYVEERQEARRVPGGASGQLVALEQHDVAPAGLGQMVGDGAADRASADDDRARLAFHRPLPPQDAVRR
jgi:hypothetical protein